MQKSDLIGRFKELDELATKLIELGEDENSLLMKHAVGLGDFMTNTANYVDRGDLSLEIGLKMLKFFHELQAEIFLARLSELMNKNNCP